MTHRRALVLIATMVLALVGTALAGPLRPPPTPSGKARAALNRLVDKIDFSKVPLEDALNFIRDSADVNLHVNWKALEAAGVNAKTPVEMRLKSVPLRKVLQLVLSDVADATPLIWYVEDGVLEISTREAEESKLITIVYDVMDLLVTPMRHQMGGRSGGIPGAGMGWGGGLGGAMIGGGINRFDERQQGFVDSQNDLTEIIKGATDYKIWRENGGRCTMHFKGGGSTNTLHTGQLIVTAPRWVQEIIGGPLD